MPAGSQGYEKANNKEGFFVAGTIRASLLRMTAAVMDSPCATHNRVAAWKAALGNGGSPSGMAIRIW